jgi:hypothetical protein
VPKISEGMIALAGLAVFAAWLFVGLPLLYLPTEIHNQQRTEASEAPQRTNNEPKGTAQSPLFVQVIPTPKSAEERAQEAEDREEKKSADRWLVRWTAALFIATVGLILATGSLGYFAWRQLRDMRASIDAGTRAAKAAERSAEIADRAVVLADRPWVSIKPEISGELAFSADTIDIFITVTIKNVGRSPATHVGVGWKMCPSIVDAAQEGRKLADSTRVVPASMGYGHILFPNEEFSYKEMLFTLPTADFLKEIEERMKLRREAGEVPENFGFPAFMFFAYYGLPSAGRMGRYRFTTLLTEVRRKGTKLGFEGDRSNFDAESLELVQMGLSGETI